jgi:hypothetical protein
VLVLGDLHHRLAGPEVGIKGRSRKAERPRYRIFDDAA